MPIAPKTLRKAYLDSGLSRDHLPYTGEFDRLYERVTLGQTKLDVWRELLKLGKKGGELGTGGRSLPVPDLSDEEKRVLRSLVDTRVGTLGKRDNLPYTREFDLVHLAFQKKTGRAIERGELWRAIASLAKVPTRRR